MRKIVTLLALLPLASVVSGQITISSTDMPVPTGSYNIFTVGATGPMVGTNLHWDYGTNSGGASSVAYSTETDPFFTSAGIDVYFGSTKTLTPGFSYLQNLELDFNTTNVKESGILVPYQLFDISSVSGTPGDTLSFPLQKSLLTTPTEIIHFPFTANSSWHSVSRRSVDFNLTVGALSLSNAAGTHAYYIYRNDTIVGWGKMRVYTTYGPSIYYDVLMDKISTYAVDSFYMGGAPASPILLGAFMVTQGQHTDSAFRYDFYRKTSFNYLMDFDYQNDPTYNSLILASIDKDNVMQAGINDVNGVMYSTVLFPNPSDGTEINLQILGKDVNAATYYITDVTGRKVQSGTAEMKSKNLVHIALDRTIVNGQYLLHVTDMNNAVIANEQLTIAH